MRDETDVSLLSRGWGASHLALHNTISSLPILPPESSFFLWTDSQKALIEGEREKWRLLAKYLDFKQAKSLGFSLKSPTEELQSEPAKKLLEVGGEYLFAQLEAIIGGWDIILKAGEILKRDIPFSHPRDYFAETQREITLKWGEELFSRKLTKGGLKYWKSYLSEETAFLSGRHKAQSAILKNFREQGFAEFWVAAIVDFLTHASRRHKYRVRYWNPLLKAQKNYRAFVTSPQNGYEISHLRYCDGGVFAAKRTGGRTLQEVKTVKNCYDFLKLWVEN